MDTATSGGNGSKERGRESGERPTGAASFTPPPPILRRGGLARPAGTLVVCLCRKSPAELVGWGVCRRVWLRYILRADVLGPGLKGHGKCPLQTIVGT